MRHDQHDPHDIDERIDRLLDQLDNAAITRSEIETIEKKITVLKSMK